MEPGTDRHRDKIDIRVSAQVFDVRVPLASAPLLGRGAGGGLAGGAHSFKRQTVSGPDSRQVGPVPEAGWTGADHADPHGTGVAHGLPARAKSPS